MNRLHPISFFLFLILCSTYYAPASQTDTIPEKNDIPFSFCLVAEMGYIPEMATWPLCSTKAYAEETKNLQAEWKKFAPWVTSQINPEIIRALSRWAIKEMKTYKKISPLAEVRFKPVHEYRDDKKIVFEALVDTLPTHSRVVTRCLLLYVIYNRPGKNIVRVTVTIRGNKLE